MKPALVMEGKGPRFDGPLSLDMSVSEKPKVGLGKVYRWIPRAEAPPPTGRRRGSEPGRGSSGLRRPPGPKIPTLGAPFNQLRV